MKTLALFFVFALCSFAQAPVISGITVDSKTYSTARIQWTSSIATGVNRVQYDSLTSTLPFANSTQLTNSNTWVQTQQGRTLGGLAPATTYYYVVCSTANGTETCSSVNNFTTLAAPAGYPTTLVKPTLPSAPVLPPMPTINGATYTVGSNCADGTTGLQVYLNTAAAVTGSANQQILIPPTTACTGNYQLNTRAGTGWIVVRTSAPDSSLPPEGVRINASYASVMPVMSTVNTYGNGLDAVFYPANPSTSNWRFVGLQFTAQGGNHRDLAVAIGTGQGSNIILDRDILFSDGFGGDTITTTGGTVSNQTAVGMLFNGSNMMVVNSWITLFCSAAATAIDITAAQGVLIDNNYINAPGISIFHQENPSSEASIAQGSNFQISRNFFAWNPAWINSVVTREHIEFKAGNLIWIFGNTFTAEWTDHQTGSYTNAIALNSRNGNIGSIQFNNYLADITIENNEFYSVPGIAGIWGDENNFVSVDTPATQRVLFRNNLAYNINGYYGSGTNSTSGQAFELRGSLENAVFSHNTILGMQGILPAIFAWNGGAGSGIRFLNNILPATYDDWWGPGNGNIAFGQDTSGQLPAPPAAASNTSASVYWNGISTASPNPDPSAQFAGNVLIPGLQYVGPTGVVSSNVAANYTSSTWAYSQSACATYWANSGTISNNVCAGSGTTTANGALATVGLFGPLGNLTGIPTVANYRLKATSAYRSGAHATTNPTTDGLDAGADIDQLEAVSGVVSGAHAYGLTSTSATVAFFAPDTFACSVDADPSSDSGNFTPGVFSRVASSPQRMQTVSLTLTAHAQYTVRVNCAVQQPTFTVKLP